MNKRLFFASIALSGLAMGIFTGCGNDEFTEVDVTPVKTLFEPADERYIPLQPAGSTYFEWERATASDNGLVYYQVLFDRKGGNFSNPLYTVAADNFGMNNGATITHKVLSRVLQYAGVESGQDGEVDWTVVSNRGLTFTKGTAVRSLKMQRLIGIDPLEGADLFMAGDGAEADHKFKALNAAQYEIYTKIDAGENYYFTSTLGGNTRYFIPGENGTFRETSELPTDITVDETSIYRINLDFDSAAIKFEKVASIQIDNSWTQVIVDLNYQGKGVWKVANYNIALAATDWGFDERYKFRITVDGTIEQWGMLNFNDGRPSIANAASREMKIIGTGTDQWTHGQFKFPNELCDLADLDRYFVDVVVYLNADRANYTHEFLNIH